MVKWLPCSTIISLLPNKLSSLTALSLNPEWPKRHDNTSPWLCETRWSESIWWVWWWDRDELISAVLTGHCPGTKSGFAPVLLVLLVVGSVADKFACQGVWAAIIILISRLCISLWQLIAWPRRQCHSLIILYKPFTVFRQTISARRPAR